MASFRKLVLLALLPSYGNLTLGASLRRAEAETSVETTTGNFLFDVDVEYREESDNNDESVICMERVIAYGMDDFAEEYLVKEKDHDKKTVQWGDVNNVTYNGEDGAIISLGIENGTETIYIWRNGHIADLDFGEGDQSYKNGGGNAGGGGVSAMGNVKGGKKDVPVGEGDGGGNNGDGEIGVGESGGDNPKGNGDGDDAWNADNTGNYGRARRGMVEPTHSRDGIVRNDARKSLKTEKLIQENEMELHDIQGRDLQEVEVQKKKKKRRRKRRLWSGAFRVRAECTFCNPDNKDAGRRVASFQTYRGMKEVDFESFMNEELADQIARDCKGVKKVHESTFTVVN